MRTIFICVCVSLSQVWTLDYKSSRFGPPLKENTPRVILFQMSLENCMNGCALRPWCTVVAYHRYGLCELFFDNISSEATQCNNDDCQDKDTRMMFIKREDLITKVVFDILAFTDNCTDQIHVKCIDKLTT